MISRGILILGLPSRMVSSVFAVSKGELHNILTSHVSPAACAKMGCLRACRANSSQLQYRPTVAYHVTIIARENAKRWKPHTDRHVCAFLVYAGFCDPVCPKVAPFGKQDQGQSQSMRHFVCLHMLFGNVAFNSLSDTKCGFSPFYSCKLHPRVPRTQGRNPPATS